MLKLIYEQGNSKVTNMIKINQKHERHLLFKPTSENKQVFISFESIFIKLFDILLIILLIILLWFMVLANSGWNLPLM